MTLASFGRGELIDKQTNLQVVFAFICVDTVFLNKKILRFSHQFIKLGLKSVLRNVHHGKAVSINLIRMFVVLE